MMRDLARKKELHNKVIHILKAKAPMRSQYAESRMVKKMSQNDLYLLCKLCFKKPLAHFSPKKELEVLSCGH